MCRQQRFQPLAQTGITVTCTVEEVGAFLRRFFQRQRKQRLFVI